MAAAVTSIDKKRSPMRMHRALSLSEQLGGHISSGTWPDRRRPRTPVGRLSGSFPRLRAKPRTSSRAGLRARAPSW